MPRDCCRLWQGESHSGRSAKLHQADHCACQIDLASFSFFGGCCSRIAIGVNNASRTVSMSASGMSNSSHSSARLVVTRRQLDLAWLGSLGVVHLLHSTTDLEKLKKIWGLSSSHGRRAEGKDAPLRPEDQRYLEEATTAIFMRMSIRVGARTRSCHVSRCPTRRHPGRIGRRFCARSCSNASSNRRTRRGICSMLEHRSVQPRPTVPIRTPGKQTLSGSRLVHSELPAPHRP